MSEKLIKGRSQSLLCRECGASEWASSLAAKLGTKIKYQSGHRHSLELYHFCSCRLPPCPHETCLLVSHRPPAPPPHPLELVSANEVSMQGCLLLSVS